MSVGRTPLIVADGGRYETTEKVERLEFDQDGGGTFIVLHFEAPVTGRETSVRAPITRLVYEAYAARNIKEASEASEEDARSLLKLVNGLGMKYIALETKAMQHHWTQSACKSALAKAMELGWVEYLVRSHSVQLTDAGSAELRRIMGC